jgi:dynein heavy chain 1
LFRLLFLLLPDLKLPHPQVNLAYDAVKKMDDLGSEAWEAAMERYHEKIDRVETRITTRLR